MDYLNQALEGAHASAVVASDVWNVNKPVNDWQLVPQAFYNSRTVVASDTWNVNLPPNQWQQIPASVYQGRFPMRADVFDGDPEDNPALRGDMLAIELSPLVTVLGLAITGFLGYLAVTRR